MGIQEVNDRLKSARIPVRLLANGGYIVLRATLPVKPGEGHGRKQYKLSLGIPNSKDGLRRAELEAQRLGRSIALGTFKWEDWIQPKSSPRDTIGGLIAEFKTHYMSHNDIQESTWRETWGRNLARLPQSEPISEALLLAVILQTEPNSNIRKRITQQLQKLADFAGLQVDLSPYKGNYSSRALEPRDIPTDAQIAEWRDRMKSESWRWAYGMLASFGLRPHELFFCTFQDAHTIRVSDGKTGDRIVRAIPPDWVQEWRLQELEADRPKVSGKTFRDFGQRVSRQFNRCEIPCDPYDLRHSYAIRGSVTLGLPLSTMAAMMGHSVQVHTQSYHRWLTDATNEAVYRRMVLKDLD